MTDIPTETVEPQWVPTPHDVSGARVTNFARFVCERCGVDTEDYRELWRWSVNNVPAFWRAVWDYFELGAAPEEVLIGGMPGARWFPGVRLNYVNQVLRQVRGDRPAIIAVSENAPIREYSWDELTARTASFAHTLRSLGVRPATGSSAICPT